MKGNSFRANADLLYRAAGLLESANDRDALAFEVRILAALWNLDMGTTRHTKAMARSKLLSASNAATFESKMSEALTAFGDSCAKIGMYGGEMDLRGALTAVREHNRLYIEAGVLTENPSWRSILQNLMHPLGLSVWLLLSQLPEWDPTEFGCSEQGIVDAIEFYQYHTVRALPPR